MNKPLLRRIQEERTRETHYQIVGFEHLVVEPQYSDGNFGRPQLMYWTIRDTRFSTGLDKWARWFVLTVPKLGDARSWVQAGGPSFWDPERKKMDRNWRPIPDGWQAGEARSEVPRRDDSGVRDAGRLGRGPRRDREVWARDGRPDRRRDSDDRIPPDSRFPTGGVTGKKYAVCPGYVTSVNDGQRHFIGFGALTWLYGVKSSECVCITPEMQDRTLPRHLENLIWLYPQRHARRYDEIREELARGADAFRLTDVDPAAENAEQTG